MQHIFDSLTTALKNAIECILQNTLQELFTQIFSDMPPIAQGNETWQLHTASKMHNDLYSYSDLERTNRLSLLKLPFRYTAGVNGEKTEDLNDYMETIAKLYASAPSSVEEYLQLFDTLGMPSQIILGVQQAYSKLITNQQARTQVESIYNTLLAKY